MPKWNPINVCSYHLQEAGATPVQELAYALATAIAVLDQVRAGGQVPPADFPQVVGRISFFVNAGVRFVTEMCKLRAFVELWDQITAERYGVADPKLRRFRYGVQVNSLGLTEQQPENNVYRILLEALAVVLSKRRARAGGAVAGMERGARPAAAMGPAVEPAPAADPGLRDRSARARRPVRRRARGRSQGPGAGRRSARGARPHRGDGRRARRGRERLHEAAPGRVERAAARRDRRRHAAGGRGQLLHRDGGLTAGRRRGRLPRDRWRGRSRADRARALPSGEPPTPVPRSARSRI